MLDREYETMRQVEDSYWWYRVLRDMAATAVARHVSARADATILDAGCGTGGTLAALRRAGAGWHLRGFDFSPLAVGLTRARGFADVRQGSIQDIPEAAECFDAVVSLDVLCCKGVEAAASLRECHRVLKPGGVLVMNLPAFGFLRGRHDTAVHAVHRFTAGELRTLHHEVGFEMRTLHYWNAWLFIPILAWRLLSRLHALRESDTEAQSDLGALPGALNSALYLAGRCESHLCSVLRPPFGTSIFSVARKPAAS